MFLRTVIAILLSVGSVTAELYINELDVDQFGTDTEEFVEIYNSGPGTVNLAVTPHVLVFFNGGDNTLPVINGSYRAVQLIGILPAGEYLVVGGSAVAEVDILIGTGGSNLIQNGPDAVALYTGLITEWSSQGPPTAVNLRDVIVYGTGDDPDVELMQSLGASAFHDEWNDQGSVGSVFSIARSPDGGPFGTGATPTPGASNDADPPLFSLEDATILHANTTTPVPVSLRGQGGVGTLRFRVRTLPQSGQLFVNQSSLTTSSQLPLIVVGPLTYLPPSGFNGVTSFMFDVVDALDRISDPAVQELAVQAGGGIVITEVMHTPGTGQSPQDQRVFEFVEVFNHTNSAISLTRLDTLVAKNVDTTGNLVIDGSPSVVPAQSMRVIAPGGLFPGSDEAFRCEWGLSESDIIRIPHERYENMFRGSRLLLFGENDVLLDAVSFSPGDFWALVRGASQSVRASLLKLTGGNFDAVGNDPIILWIYTGPKNFVGLRFSYSGVGLGSPGFVPAGYNEGFQPLPECLPPPLGACCLPNGTCAVLSEFVCFDLGGMYNADHTPCADVKPCSQPPVGACCMPNGACLEMNTVDCIDFAGTLEGAGDTCSGVSCTPSLLVSINEIDYVQAGTDTREYVELYGRPGLSLFGYDLALYNAAPNQLSLYRIIPLKAFMPDDGYFVIGSANVPNVDQIEFTVESIQNGSPDGIALIAPLGDIAEALAYGDSFTAVNGPAEGVFFESIGVEDVAPPDGGPAQEIVLQRIPNGAGAWTVTTDGGFGPDGTPGAINTRPLPAPYGACCLPDGSCISFVEALVCETAGGGYVGDGSECTGTCPELFGACCRIDGSCIDTTTAVCDAVAGMFFQPGTTCSDVACELTVEGACCLADGACVITLPNGCGDVSGTYMGDATTCSGPICGALQPIKINEIRRDDASLDDMEFIELYGPGGVGLEEYTLIVIEGDSSLAGQQGRIDKVWPLLGESVPNDGFFVLGDSAVAEADFVIGDINQLENGTGTILLIRNYDQGLYPQGTDIDFDNDGFADAPIALGEIVDGIGFADDGIDDDPSDAVYFGVVTIGPEKSAAPAGVARVFNGFDTESPSDFCTLSLAGDGTDGGVIPSPGSPNTCFGCAMQGDGTGDGTIDLHDFAVFQVCRSQIAKKPDCEFDVACLCVDFDLDGDVDLDDFASFFALTFP